MTDTDRRFDSVEKAINGLEKAVYGNGQPGLLTRMTKLETEHDLRGCAAESTTGGDAVKLSGDNLKNIIILILLIAAAASPFASKLL